MSSQKYANQNGSHVSIPVRLHLLSRAAEDEMEMEIIICYKNVLMSKDSMAPPSMSSLDSRDWQVVLRLYFPIFPCSHGQSSCVSSRAAGHPQQVNEQLAFLTSMMQIRLSAGRKPSQLRLVYVRFLSNSWAREFLHRRFGVPPNRCQSDLCAM